MNRTFRQPRYEPLLPSSHPTKTITDRASSEKRETGNGDGGNGGHTPTPPWSKHAWPRLREDERPLGSEGARPSRMLNLGLEVGAVDPARPPRGGGRRRKQGHTPISPCPQKAWVSACGDERGCGGAGPNGEVGYRPHRSPHPPLHLMARRSPGGSGCSRVALRAIASGDAKRP